MPNSQFLVSIETDAPMQPDADAVRTILTTSGHYSERARVWVDRYDRQPANEAESVTQWRVVTQTGNPIRQSLIAQFVTIGDAVTFLETLTDIKNVAIVRDIQLR